jgi:quercetin dioxygenase-like cupin family protein
LQIDVGKEVVMERSKLDGYGFEPGAGPAISFRGTKMVLKVSGEQSQGAFSLIEMTHPPNVGPALHVHPTGHEAFYVLEGRYQIRCGEVTYEGIPGSFVFVPKGLAHSYQVGSNGGRVLVLSPAGLENYFAEVSQRLLVETLSVEQEQNIARRYGQEFIDMIGHWGQ